MRSKPPQTRAERAGDAGLGAPCFVPEDAWRRLLPLLVETERCYVEPRFGGETASLVMDELRPYDFELALDFNARGGEFQLIGRFRRDDKNLPQEAHVLLVVEGEKGWLVRSSGQLSQIDFAGAAAWIKALRRGRFQRVPRRSMPKLYKVFERSTTLPKISSPAVLNVKTVHDLRPQPELRLESGPEDAVGEVNFRYGDDVVRAARPGSCFFSSKTGHLVVRNLALESQHAVRLLDLGFHYDPQTHRFSISADRLPNAAPELYEYGWQITGKSIPFRPPSDLEVDIESTDEWIELSVTVHFGDQSVGLPALLEAIQMATA